MSLFEYNNFQNENRLNSVFTPKAMKTICRKRKSVSSRLSHHQNERIQMENLIFDSYSFHIRNYPFRLAHAHRHLASKKQVE